MTLKRFLMASCLIASACATHVEPETGLSEEAAEAIYLQRFDALRDRTGTSGLPAYDNLKPMAGAAEFEPLARASAETVFGSDTLEAATSYAAANNSSSLIIWKDGAIVSETYFGDANADTLLVSKSLAKPLSVVAVGRALQEGYITSLDQPMADFIHEWQGTPKETIRIRDVLGMHSGLLPQAAAFEADNVLNRAYLHPYHDRVIIEDYPMVAEPGEVYAYSNANGDLIAPLIERATGMGYADWLTQAVFEPLGAKGGEIWFNRDGGVPHSGCCAMLPADTYLRLAVLLVQNGEWEGEALLSPEFIAEIKAPGPGFPNAGMGLYLGTPYSPRLSPGGPDIEEGGYGTPQSEPFLRDDVFFFDGNSNQVAYMVPSENLVILRTGSWPPEEPGWDNAVLPNLFLGDLED
ncbi:serine hydrolase [Ponticaulis sp.]|uniref:serine hydrolase domain-containing protein n=1 Tax=Ponticaulis sp. TaxID=2020902 RepID=UPI002627BD19|nr:serine hydrolase [Ponticaulis sp.]MDF1679694.1 serine hydrolase [Ponticaulis sp.]